MQLTVEAGKAATPKTTCPTHKVVKEPLGIWQLFEPMHARQIQAYFAVGITRCTSQRALVDEQPSLRHAHGNDTHDRL